MNDNQSKDRVVVVGVRFYGEELSAIDELASTDGRTRSGLIRKVMTDYINKAGIKA